MRTCLAAAAIGVMMTAAGCGGSRRVGIAETLPGVTLTLREATDDEITLTFLVENLERASWRNRELRIGIAKSGEAPAPGGPRLPDPPSKISVALRIGKVAGGETVLFVPLWGKSSVPTEFLDLPAPGGGTNAVTLPGFAQHRITQILTTCTGPNRRIPFDPGKGIDLVTVGYPPNAYRVRLWADRRSND